jgi:Tetratricopeptide repeat
MKKRALAFAAAALLSHVPAAVFAQGAAPPPPVAPAPAGEADAHFRRGVDLYKETDYAAALIEFRRAYELDPRYQALYNIGETHYQLQDYASALRTFEKYLRDGGAAISAGRRDEVQKSIEKLRTRVATVEVTANYPGVEIAVDDLPVGKTPLAEPLMVSAGRRKVTATRAGKQPVTQIVELAGGDTKKLAMIVPDDGAVPEVSSGKTPPAPWVITGVFAGAAVVTGAIALDASSAVKSDIGTLGVSPHQLSSDHGKTVGFAAATDVLVGCAVVAGAISIYFTVTAGKHKPGDEKSAPAPAARREVGPRVSLASPPDAGAQFVRLQAGPQSVLLSGTF